MRRLVLVPTLCLALLTTAYPAPAAESGPVSGRVLDTAGNPAGDAVVYLVQHRTRGEPLVRRVPTGADGSFTFMSLPPTDQGLRLVAQKDGFGAGLAVVNPGDPRSGIEIALKPPVELTGRVLDKAGKPIPSASVRLVNARWEDNWVWFPEALDAFSARSDATGAFRMRGLPEGTENFSLAFEHPRYAKWQLWVETFPRAPVTARLRPAARLVGRVVYEKTGHPAAGVKIAVRQESGPDNHYRHYATVVTDRNGRYRAEQLPPGRYMVSLTEWEQPAGWTATARRVEGVPEGKEAVCSDLVLIRGGLVTGVVGDRETGRPIAEARVSANRSGVPGWEPGGGAMTGPKGVFSLRLPPGRWRVQAWHPRYVQPWRDQRETTQVEVAAGQTVRNVRFALAPTLELHGVVLTPDGRPAAGAKLIALWERNGRTRPDGTFTLSGFEPDSTTTLIALGADRALKAVAELPIRSGESEPVILRLTRGVTVTGRLTNDEGMPLAGAKVRAECRVQINANSWYHAEIDTTTSDAEGRFTLWLLPDLEHRVIARAEGYGQVLRPTVSAKADGVDLGTLTLHRANRFIAGRVTDVYGQPVAGARISAWLPEPQEHRATTTDDRGRYRIEGLPPGRAQLSLEHPGAEFDFRVVETGATDADFVLLRRESAPPRDRLKPGDAAPEIGPATWLNGRGIPSLKALRGKVVLLQFGAAHNPAVEATARQLEALTRRYGGRVAVVALYDASLPAKELAAYARARNLRHLVGVVAPSPGLGWDSPAFRRYGVHAVPSLFLIDRRGRVRAVNPAPEVLERQVRRLLQARS